MIKTFLNDVKQKITSLKKIKIYNNRIMPNGILFLSY